MRSMTETAAASPLTTGPRRRRPWLLWGLAAVVIGIAVVNGALAWDHARNASAYRDLGVSYPPELRALLAAGWCALLSVLGVGLFCRKRWARRWILVILSNYGAFGVLWLLVYAQSDYSRGRIAFQAVVTALLIGLLAWMMRWRRLRAPFEHEHHEQGITTEDTEAGPQKS